MANLIQILDWDSNFFDLRICKILNNLSHDVTDELINNNINLAYFSSPNPNTYFSKDFDIILVDRKTTFKKEIIKNTIPDQHHNIKEFKGNYPTKKLFDLAISSGIYSRFKIDKNIPEIKFEDLYKEWIINSVNKKIAMNVLVYTIDEEIIGFVTLGEKNSIADIGLIAVGQSHRGHGIGKSLMFAAENWFSANNYNCIQVVTQGYNVTSRPSTPSIK